jgi:hypothetical protein
MIWMLGRGPTGGREGSLDTHDAFHIYDRDESKRKECKEMSYLPPFYISRPLDKISDLLVTQSLHGSVCVTKLTYCHVVTSRSFFVWLQLGDQILEWPTMGHSSKHSCKDPNRKSKKRHGYSDEDDGSSKKRRKHDKLKIVDDDPDDDTMWVEKNIDMDGERVRDLSTSNSLITEHSLKSPLLLTFLPPKA